MLQRVKQIAYDLILADDGWLLIVDAGNTATATAATGDCRCPGTMNKQQQHRVGDTCGSVGCELATETGHAMLRYRPWPVEEQD